MTYLMWLALLASAFGLLLWDRQARLVVYLLATFIFFEAAWITGLLPQTLVLSLLSVIPAVLWAIHERTGRARILAISFPFLAGAIIAFVASQWQNPHPGELVDEDREHRKPEPLKQLTVDELLAKDWSTNDEFADWPVTRLMARLCEIAYKPPVDARTELANMGFESESINAGSMNGYVLKIEDSAVIILRGTEASVFDVLQDMSFVRIATAHGDLHGGFSSGYTSMHGQVRKLLDRYHPKRVWITGHSLGGALAVVCAYELLQDDKHRIAGVMTFGQPMVVESNLADYLAPKLRGKYVHFVNNMDPVVNIVRPYVHFGHLVWLKGDAIVRSKDGMAAMMEAGPARARGQKKDVSLEPMTQTDFRKFLRDERDARKPKFDAQGHPVAEGNWRDIGDHYMESYAQMVELLIRKSGSAPQEFINE